MSPRTSEVNDDAPGAEEGGVVPNGVQDAAALLLEELKRSGPAMLWEHRGIRQGFVKRNRRRWKKGFDRLEVLIVMSHEIGELINTPAPRPKTLQYTDHKFDALVSLHARAVLVAREILCLMTGGFADGALGRWRTLHEIAVIASFLSEQDGAFSERYLLHHTVQSYKAAEQYRRYESAANLVPFADKDLEDIEAAKSDVMLKHGKSMLSDWGWAAPALNKERPTFFDIEEYCGLDHWRPRYRWSSRDTHGNYRPHGAMLAMSEGEQQGLLAGPSNSGMTEPAQMMAASLILATDALVQIEPQLDRMILMQALRMLSEEIGETFIALERESLKRHRRRAVNL